MGRSESEETARAKFDAYLRAQRPSWELAWRDGEDPPDYYLQIGSVTFVVEVTRLLKQYPIGRRKLPMRAIAAELEAFLLRVEDAARDYGCLQGGYAVGLPRAIPDLVQNGPVLMQRMLSILAELQSAPTGVRRSFFRSEGREFAITKVTSEGSDLWMTGPSDSAWEGQAEAELAALVAERVRTKAVLLSRSALPAILLLDERYPFAMAEMYSRLDSAQPELRGFHSVFVARRHDASILLKSGFAGLLGVWDQAAAT